MKQKIPQSAEKASFITGTVIGALSFIISLFILSASLDFVATQTTDIPYTPGGRDFSTLIFISCAVCVTLGLAALGIWVFLRIKSGKSGKTRLLFALGIVSVLIALFSAALTVGGLHPPAIY